MKHLKQISEELKQLYVAGLSKNQRILVFVVLGLVVVNVLLLALSLGSRHKAEKIGLSSNLMPIEEQENKHLDPRVKPEDDKRGDSEPVSGEVNFIDQIDPPQNKDDNPVPQLPEIKNSSIQNTGNSPPGPMDGTIAKIKEDYKNDPKYILITGYLEPLKEIADGRRAWNSWFKQSAVEFFGKQKADEIENEIKRINGNKEDRIRRTSFNTLDEVTAAIKKDTENYIEKAAINGFLDQAKMSSDGKYPWTGTMIGSGEINLEKAWVDKVDERIRPVKSANARKFQAVNYATLDQLITAIKKDTKNYEQIIARDMFLDYIRDKYNSRNLTVWDVDGGGNLLEEYHLSELKKFVNKK